MFRNFFGVLLQSSLLPKSVRMEAHWPDKENYTNFITIKGVIIHGMPVPMISVRSNFAL